MAVRPAGLGGVARPHPREQVREAVVDTALRLFTEHGYLGVRVADIAREAGVSRATLYRYFSEREEILVALFERLLGTDGQLEDDLTAHGTGAAEPIEKRIQRIAHDAAAQMLKQERLARFVYRLPVRHDYMLKPESESTPSAFRRIHHLIEEGVQTGEIRSDTPVDVLCAQVHDALEAAMRDWAEHRAEEPYERLDLLLDIVFHGVLQNGRRPGTGTQRPAN